MLILYLSFISALLRHISEIYTNHAHFNQQQQKEMKLEKLFFSLSDGRSFARIIFVCWLIWLCTKHLHLDKLVIHCTDRNGWDTQHDLCKCVACCVREYCAEPCLRNKRNEQFEQIQIDEIKKRAKTIEWKKKPVACAVFTCTESFAIGTDF